MRAILTSFLLLSLMACGHGQNSIRQAHTEKGSARTTLAYLNESDYAVFKQAIPNWPAAGSPAQTQDINELFSQQRARTPADCSRAQSEVTISLQNFFGGPYGELTDAQVQALTPFFDQLHQDLNYFVQRMKTDFARPRPYDYIPGLKPCISRDPSYAYPSGHTTTSVLYALVLAEIYPSLANQLSARADQIGNDRVLGGVHHPTDVVAGHTLAQELFITMKQNPNFVRDLQRLSSSLTQ